MNGATPAGRRAVSMDLMATMVIVFLAATSPAFDTDDASFFNYLNNVVDARPLYFYTGYVHVIPQVVTYALSPLPLLWQVLLYPVLPVVLAVALYFRLSRLFRRRAAPWEANALALCTIIVLRVVQPVMWANLSNSNWTALLLAAVVILDAGMDDAPYSAWTAAGVVIAGLAFPPGVTIAVLLMIQWARVRRLQPAILAVLIVGGHIIIGSLSPEPGFNTRLLEAPWMFVSSFREYKLIWLITIASVLSLAMAFRWSLRPEHRSEHLAIIGSLCAMGWLSLGLYVASTRFVRYDGGIPPRYAVPVMFCGLVAVAWMALSQPDALERSRRLGIYIGTAIACGVIFFYSNLRGPMEIALMKYRFVSDAAAWRQDCKDDQVLVFEADAASPVMFCRPRLLPEGDNIIRSFTPMIGEVGDGDIDEDLPYVISPRPLFP
jgi:hypothetical protein